MLVDAKVFLVVGQLVVTKNLQLLELVLRVKFMEEVDVFLMQSYVLRLLLNFLLEHVWFLKDIAINQFIYYCLGDIFL
jgi:hypothetical protein